MNIYTYIQDVRHLNVIFIHMHICVDGKYNTYIQPHTLSPSRKTMHNTAPHSTILQHHTAPYYNALQHTATHSWVLGKTSFH